MSCSSRATVLSSLPSGSRSSILHWNPAVKVYGPGPAGSLPRPALDPPAGHRIPVINPQNPTPGLVDLTSADEHWIRGVAGSFDGEVTVGGDLLELRP